MAQISANLVKELREMTGLAMMECKRALSESQGDLKKAEELLRIRSGARASKVAGRIAAEGLIGSWLAPDAKLGALVEVNCETDFVAKNAELLAFAGSLAEITAHSAPVNVAALSAIGDVELRRQGLVQKINENISIRRFQRVAAKGKLALYVHAARIGVLVDYEGPDGVGRDVAMHVSFARPQYLVKGDVPEDLVQRERGILEARARESGKPAEIVARMVEGGLGKFFGEVTLLGQPFIKDDKLSVEKMLAAHKAKVFGYRYLVVGEGIARRGAEDA